MVDYRELFSMNTEEIDHHDPHFLFERLATAVNDSDEFDNRFSIVWDCERMEYTFMMENAE